MCCAVLKGKICRYKTNIIDNKDGTGHSERCPLCQAPLQLFAASVQHKHVSECLNKNLNDLPECPDGAVCHSSDAHHYSVFCHNALAGILAGCGSSADGLTARMSQETDSDQLQSSQIECCGETPASSSQPVSSGGCDVHCVQEVSEAKLQFGDHETCIRDNAMTTAGCGSDHASSAVESTDLPRGEQHLSESDDCLVIKSVISQSVSSTSDSFYEHRELAATKCQQAKAGAAPGSLHRYSRSSADSSNAMTCSDDVTIHQMARKCSSQSSIRTFFKPVSGVQQNKTNKEALPSPSDHSVSHKKLKVDGGSSSCSNMNSVTSASSNGSSAQLAGSKVSPQESSNRSTTDRKCPFYKWIPGTAITVDAFSYGSIPGCSAYFLSHFHYDHYVGLNKSFKHKIYCSQVTANLVKLRLRVASHLICPLPLDVKQSVGDVEVTLLDANHCPGSVMFLFKKKSCVHYARAEYILHTGDFRAHKEMHACQQLQSLCISQLFLDTTYCDPSYVFPCQQDVINFAVRTSVEFLQAHRDALIVVGAYTIGKERLFRAIADTLDCKVCVTRDKKAVLECLEDELLRQRLTLEKREARVHVVPMNTINVHALTAYLDSLQHQFDHVLAFEPTGWTYSNKILSVDNIRPRSTTSRVTLYGVPYSEHSSYEELRAFIQFTRPAKIIPTVNNGSAQSRQNMTAMFESWLTASPNVQQVPRQTALSSWFT